MGIWPTSEEERLRWAAYVEKKFPRPPRALLSILVESAFSSTESFDVKSIAHNPEKEPTDPALLKLRMGRTEDGRLLALCYAEYIGLPPGVKVKETLIEGTAGPVPDNAPTQHVLDAEICKNETEAREWFARVCVSQPWIERN